MLHRVAFSSPRSLSNLTLSNQFSVPATRQPRIPKRTYVLLRHNNNTEKDDTVRALSRYRGIYDQPWKSGFLCHVSRQARKHRIDAAIINHGVTFKHGARLRFDALRATRPPPPPSRALAALFRRGRTWPELREFRLPNKSEIARRCGAIFHPSLPGPRPRDPPISHALWVSQLPARGRRN